VRGCRAHPREHGALDAALLGASGGQVVPYALESAGPDDTGTGHHISSIRRRKMKRRAPLGALYFSQTHMVAFI
jgi:hypothetical protein